MSSLLLRAVNSQRARLARSLSSAAGGPPATGPGSTIDHAGSAAVIAVRSKRSAAASGRALHVTRLTPLTPLLPPPRERHPQACYVGAGLWLYNDYLEKPKPPNQSAEALAAASTAVGVEAIAADLSALREKIETMDETSRWLAGGCRTGPLVVVGTGGGADSLYSFRVAPARNMAVPVGEPLRVGPNPAFVSVGKGAGGGVLYVAHEGAVSAVAVDARAATLARLGGAQASNGAGTAYAECDGPQCRHVLAANYAGGSVCVLPVLPDGSLGAATDAKHHAGPGLVKPHLADRQEAAHPHSVRVDPWEGKWALVPDLGLDTVFVYAYDALKGVLSGAPSAERHWRAAEGAGPRHICFSPVRARARRAPCAARAPAVGRAQPGSDTNLTCPLSLAPQPSRAAHLVYALSELTGTVSTLQMDGASGALSELQTISLLPPDVSPTRQGHCGSAEIAMHPNGKFVYASNRCVPGRAPLPVCASGACAHGGRASPARHPAAAPPPQPEPLALGARGRRGHRPPLDGRQRALRRQGAAPLPDQRGRRLPGRGKPDLKRHCALPDRPELGHALQAGHRGRARLAARHLHRGGRERRARAQVRRCPRGSRTRAAWVIHFYTSTHAPRGALSA